MDSTFKCSLPIHSEIMKNLFSLLFFELFTLFLNQKNLLLAIKIHVFKLFHNILIIHFSLSRFINLIAFLLIL